MILTGVNRPGRGETAVINSRSPGLGAEVILNRPLTLIRQQRCCDPAGERNEYSWTPHGRGMFPFSMFDVLPMGSEKELQLFRASCFLTQLRHGYTLPSLVVLLCRRGLRSHPFIHIQ